MSQFHVAIMGPVDIHDLATASGDHLGSFEHYPVGHPGAQLIGTFARAVHRAVRVSVITTDRHVDETVTVSLASGLSVTAVRARGDSYGRDLHRHERHMMAEVLSAIEADVVHAHWTYEYALAALSRAQCPVIVGMHDWAPAILRHTPHPYNLARIAMQLVAVRRATAVTVNSPYLQGKAALLGRKAIVIPNIVPAPRFVPTTALRRDDTEPLLLAVNNGFHGLKNGPTLLRAFGLIRKEASDAGLVLVGAGYEPDGVAAEWANQRGLQGGVTFAGQRSPAEVEGLMRSATLFVHTSLEESFGMVIAEAMAAGIPVVAGERSGAVPWLLGGGEYGFLCDVSSPPAVAAAVLGLLADEEWRQRLAVAAHQRARRDFGEESVASHLIGLYRVVSQDQGRTR